MNALIPFNFENHTVRVIQDDNGEPLFVAKDVCDILGYSNDRDAVARHCQSKGVVKRDTLTEGGLQQLTYIGEGNLYRLIIKSNKPEAKPFEAFVCDEVLPSIRKTGSYSLAPTLPGNYLQALEALVMSEKAKDQAIRTKAEIGCRREATSMATASVAVREKNRLEIQLDKSMQYCTVKRMSMIHHGQKFNWRVLKDTSIAMEIPAIDVFDQNYGTVKGYHVDVWLEAYAVSIDGGAS
jgi:prophage antirepressor-like protein